MKIMIFLFNLIKDNPFINMPMLIDNNRTLVIGYNGKRYVISARVLKDVI
jgi:hypothetical protein